MPISRFRGKQQVRKALRSRRRVTKPLLCPNRNREVCYMRGQQLASTQLVKQAAILAWITTSVFISIAGQGTAVQLLKEGTSYQSADDTSDRAAISYRLVIQKYPSSPEAEQAQYFLGTYYEKKFFLLEGKSKEQDWSSF